MQQTALICIHNGHANLAAQMLTKARTLFDNVYAVVFSSDDITVAGQYGAGIIFHAEISDPLSGRYVSAVSQVIQKYSPDAVLFPATPLFKSVASRLAARLECGLTADCIDLYFGEDNRLYQIAPAFSGNASATILIPRTRPQMVSILGGISVAKKCPVSPEIINLDVSDTSECEIISRTISKIVKFSDSVILSAGYGIGSKSNFDKMCRLAEFFGAGIGATLSAVDAGYASSEFLIGQTGAVVSPRVYVAFGISGQIQHLVGMKNSGCIVSVNRDPFAPLNSCADYFVEGDCNCVIDQMLEYFYEKR